MFSACLQVRPEEVGEGGNQYNHAINSGVRFVSSSNNGSGAHREGLLVETLDAGMACPMVAASSGLLGDSTPMGEGTPGYDGNVTWTGMAINLYNNLMPISGYAQWWPFGMGQFYQKKDESMSFRFRLSSTLVS